MPDPVAQPSFAQEGTSLPKGSSTELDEGLDVAASAPEQPQFDTAQIDESELPEFTGESTPDETDEVLFGPSDFPNRPLTHGVPMGPGANFVVTPRMSDREILARAATSILESRNDLPSEAVLFAARVLAGD